MEFMTKPRHDVAIDYQRKRKSGMKESFVDKDERELQLLRNKVGLTPQKEGHRRCLNCNKQFYSLDLSRQRMCDNCRYNKE